MRAKAKKPYDVSYGGLSLRVLPNVYAPEFFDDSLWYAKQLQKIVGKKSLLEVGTGSGVIAIFCAKSGARVVATDISKNAVKNARFNAARHNLAISVRQGDIYSPIKSNEKFDFIFWAHPFNNWKITIKDDLLKTGIDPSYRSLKKYISGARKHLALHGKLLLGTGDSADLKMVEKIAKRNNYRLKLLKKVEQPLAKGQNNRIIDLIYEFIPYAKK